MEVGVLGPLELREDGRTVEVLGGQQRALLAVLVARRGRVVPADVLIEALWGEEPPRTATHTLHTHASRLRRSQGVPLRAVDGGYLLELGAERVDGARFEALVAGAAAGPATEAVRLLEEALALWRGPAFGRAADLVAVRGEALRLDEARCAAREQLASALHHAGRAADAVAVLEALVADEPYRETAWAQLARALTAAGRPVDGVAAVARATASLDELGLRPSADLRAAQQEALRGRPARTTARPSLPVPASTLVGREQDLAAVDALVGTEPLVTLLGPGGVGKTRLALEVARRRGQQHRSGVRLVELATLTDGAAVPAATVAALELSGEGGTTSTMLRRAGTLDLLVVLDNCEHVIEAVAAVVEDLLAAGGPLRVLATSRERLEVAGERVHAVAPLAVDGTDPAARRLFVERARAAGAWATDPEPAEVDRVVRELDGLPLAIEMAAARAATVGLVDLGDQLATGAARLAHPGRGTEPRHRTLASVIAWSSALLDDAERAVLADWPVFAGPVRPADATAVLEAATEVPERLVRRSLLALDVRDGRTRYRMLHTVRSAVLDSAPVRPALQRRHAEWFLDVARQADAALRTSAEPEACALLSVQVADLRAAHAWARTTDPALAARLSGALHVHATGTMNDEILGWAARLGPVLADDDPEGAAAQVSVAARLVVGGELRAGEQRARRALEVADDDRVRMTALEVLGDVALYDGRLDDSAALGLRLVELARSLGDPHYVMTGLSYPILCASYAGRYDEARELLDRTREEMDRFHDLGPTVLGNLAYASGEIEIEHRPAVALAHLERAATLAEQSGCTFLGGVARVSASSVRARHGDPAAAMAAFDEVVRWWLVRANRTHLVTTLRNLVDLLERVGADTAAAELWGAVVLGGGSVSFGAERARLDRARERLQSRLGADRFAELADVGATLDPETAARHALSAMASGPAGA
ncbi:BTAD domain-containing putative transcriptional regulator [Cellulomonas sp.]|uniref:BTAD domain-containing putative transcriptional regulator n=1 Tax=Cellulomonas sp. TaxID=40001 RepID=UPI003BAAAF51